MNLNLLLSEMRITTIILNGVEHNLLIPIDIIEEPYISNGERMIKMYNDTFRILGYGNDTNMTRDCIREEINLIINSYLYDSEYIHKKPMLEKCIILHDKILHHLYGINQINSEIKQC